MNNMAIYAWILAILTAFATSIEAGFVMAIGYASQFAKAQVKYDTRLVMAGVAVLCFVGFWASNRVPPAEWDVEYFQKCIMWVSGALTTASVAAATKGAPQTDTLGVTVGKESGK